MRKLLSLLPVAFVLLFAAIAARADTCNGFTNNLVSNCGFESGSFSSWTGSATTAGANYAGIDTSDPFTTMKTPYQGSFEAYLGSLGSTITLTQTLATTAGSTYLIEFALLNDTSASPGYVNSFAVLFGGASIFSESAAPLGGYMLYTASGVATSSTTALSFVSRNDGGYFELDSTSVTAAALPVSVTPEPSSWLLLASGMAGCAGVARRRLLAASPDPVLLEKTHIAA